MVVTDADSRILVVLPSDKKEYYKDLIKRLSTIVGLSNAVYRWCSQRQALCQQVYQIIKKHQRFFLDEDDLYFFAIHDEKPTEEVYSDYLKLCIKAGPVLIDMACGSAWGKPETEKTRLKVLKLAKKLLGAMKKVMEVLAPEGAPAVLGLTRIAYIVNTELVALNLQLRNRDPEVFPLVKELATYERHGLLWPPAHSLIKMITDAVVLDLREEGGGSSDDVIWQALCSVIPSLVPLGRCEGCEKVEEESHAFSVCAQCKTAVYCSSECQRAHWKQGGHKTTCHPKATGA
jgi:hypothetical protein